MKTTSASPADSELQPPTQLPAQERGDDLQDGSVLTPDWELSPDVEDNPVWDDNPVWEDIPAASTVRIEHTDAHGQPIGYSLITETEWDSFTETYDQNDNLLKSHYSSIDGGWETIERIPPPELQIGPHPLSHAHRVVGAWAADGSSYERSELFDIHGNLVRSEGFHADGSSDLYELVPWFGEDGSLAGYQGTWIWTDPDGETSRADWSDHFDASLNPVFGPDEDPHPSKGLGDSGEDDLVWVTSLWPGIAYRNLTGVVPADTPQQDPEASDPSIDTETSEFGTGETETGDSETSETEWEPVFAPFPADDDVTDPAATGPLDAAELDQIASSGFNPLFRDLSVNDVGVPAAGLPPTITSDSSEIRLNRVEYSDITHATLLGASDLLLRGNRLDNTLVGNEGNNRIAGGHGEDLIVGGNGSDLFVLRNQHHSRDTITDFDPEQDRFLLKGRDLRDLFTRSGSELRDNVINNALVLEEATGQLLYAPPGEGSGEMPITLAVLPGLAASDLRADLFMLG